MRLLSFATLLLFAACQSPAPPAETTTVTANASAVLPAENSSVPTASPTEPTPDPDWLLVPGKSAGKTALGQTSEEVTKRLGPANAGDAAMQHAVAVWYAGGKAKTGNSVAIFTVRDAGNDPEARIKQIRVNSPRFQTKEGIGAGSSLAEIKVHYSLTPTNRYTELDKAYTLFDSNKGIGFEVDDKEVCTSVIVHAANEAFSGTYLNFR